MKYKVGTMLLAQPPARGLAEVRGTRAHSRMGTWFTPGGFPSGRLLGHLLWTSGSYLGALLPRREHLAMSVDLMLSQPGGATGISG